MKCMMAHAGVALAMLLMASPAPAAITLSTSAYPGPSIPDALGGDGTAMHPTTGSPLTNQGLEWDQWQTLIPGDDDFPVADSSARRQAMNSIPNLFDWAIYDPSGTGDDSPSRAHVQGRVTTLGGTAGPLGAYHSGEQVEWESMFSDPEFWGVDSADGLGADIFLTTGNAVPSSSNTSDMRATDSSGKLGLTLDAGGFFTLDATLPEGKFLVHLLGRDNGLGTASSATFDGDSVGITLTDADDLIITLTINNMTGSDQNLNVVLGATSGDYRLGAIIIQTVPEPGSALALAGLGLVGLIRRQRR